MKKINLTYDLGKKEVEDKWKGKFLDDSSYDSVIRVTENTGIMNPTAIPPAPFTNRLGY